MKPLKTPMCLDCQVRNLKENHGLIIEDTESAKEILKRVNYYRLSGYGIGLLNPESDSYEGNSSIETLYSLYVFDSALRNIISPVLEYIEVEFRTAIAYHLAVTYGAECYRNRDNFNPWYSDVKQKDMFEDFNNHVDIAITQQKNKPFVKHHQTVYGGHYPIWVIVEVLSLGSLSTLYSLMKPKDRSIVAKQFKTSSKHFKSWFASFVELRNICAHYGRLYNMPLDSLPKLSATDIAYSNCRLFSVLLAMRYILNGTIIWNHFVEKLTQTISSCPAVNLNFIGFPENWKELLE